MAIAGKRLDHSSGVLVSQLCGGEQENLLILISILVCEDVDTFRDMS